MNIKFGREAKIVKRILLVSSSIIVSLFLLGCSNPINGAGGSSLSEKNTLNEITQKATEVFMKKAEEKGLTEIKVKTLSNLGFTEQEVLNLSAEKIAEIFAPGTLLDGAGLFIPNKNQIEELKKVGINDKMSVILGNLGYKYEEMLRLSAQEIDFIFPNTELMANLVQRGYSNKVVQGWLDEGKSYKEVIKEALTK